jgi:tRNA modification GTPase
MLRAQGDTIFAPATAPGRAAIAIIRLSGPGSRDACEAVTGAAPPPPRHAALRRLCDPARREVLDRGLVLWFPAEGSATGEDVLELQVHGGRAVVGGLLEALAGLPGLRPAEPGEFSRRAFMNGRMDLTEAEGLADLIEAETRAQARQALRQMEGELGCLYESWRDVLLSALARLEAEIDFAPEEEVPDGLLREVRPEIERLSAEIAAHLADDRRGERLRDGLTVAVIGAPNAGKSSLVNRLARRDVAIVTATPGTTRDVLEVPLDLKGFPVTVLDTAGLREVAEMVEAEGVRRARTRAESADLRLALFDGASWPDLDAETLGLIGEASLIVVNKTDLGRVPREPLVAGQAALRLSCLTGEGFGALCEALGAEATRRLTSQGGVALTRSRHRAAVRETAEALARFCSSPDDAELVLKAEDLRLAARSLGRITGRVAVDDLLDRIFSEFCIGK